MVDVTRPRTRTLWMLAVAFAVTGVLLLDPWQEDHPAPVESPGSEPDEDIVAIPPSPREIREGTPPTPIESEAPTQPPDDPDAAEPWDAVAAGFADAFTAETEDHADWVAGLEPWVTSHLTEQYEHTDASRRPSGAVDSVETVTPGDYSAHVRITYDTGLVLMARLANGPGGWRVTYVEPTSGS